MGLIFVTKNKTSESVKLNKHGDTMKNKCIIFTGGTPVSAAGFEKSEFDDCFIIAADSGCAQLEILNNEGFRLLPDILLGDMDSFDKTTALENYPGARFLSFPPEKDYTDTQLALETAEKEGYNDIIIIGGTGNRADHYLANLALLRKCANEEIKLSICDGKNRIFYHCGGKLTLRDAKKYKYFSILPDGAPLLGVKISGAKYCLNNADVDRDMPITVSNEITSDICEIEILRGNAFIVQCSD